MKLLIISVASSVTVVTIPTLSYRLARRQGARPVALGLRPSRVDEIEQDIILRLAPHCAAERIVVAPDCGLKYLSRDAALGKIKSMVDGAAIVREELK